MEDEQILEIVLDLLKDDSKIGVVLPLNIFELNDTLRNDYITAYPDEIELMQSTGLKDKNGKEIFEGDIVRTTRFLGRADEIGGFYEYEKDYVGVVKVLEGSWVIDTGSVAVRLWSEIDESEVLGNIYENLEFLEVNE
ncbi:YopX family protein [Streptococcus pneumoniae]|nr:YopX family protein [Streptococcus pneumoniae]